MSQFDGILRPQYEVHCRECEHPEMGLGGTHAAAVASLKKSEWRRDPKDKLWRCWRCEPGQPLIHLDHPSDERL